MLSQACSPSRRISQCRTILSHRHLRARFLTVPAPSTNSSQIQRPPVRTAHVRTWEPPKNIADTYAVLRALERKYGRIIEARFLKDYEDPSRYQMMFWVIFEDPESLQRIPPKGGEFVFKTPKLLGEKHELSMEELEYLAQREDFSEEADVLIEEQKGENGNDPQVSGGRIVRAESDLVIPGKYFQTIFQMTPKPVMGAFLRWGGFQPLKPLPTERTIEEFELFGKSDLDNVRMRAALQLSAKVLGVPNPSIRPTGEQASQISQVQTLSSLVFGDGSTAESISSEVESPESIPLRSTTEVEPPTQPASTPKTSSKTSKTTVTPRPEPTPPPPKEKDAATIAAELKSQELLKRQLEFARQLKGQASATRRKQPKPQIKAPPTIEKPPAFFEDAQPLPDFEAPKPGVMDRLWGMFGRK